MSAVTSRNDGPDYPQSYMRRVDTPPVVNDLRQAEFWIGVLHRRSVVDARSIADLAERVRYLERRNLRLGRWAMRGRRG